MAALGTRRRPSLVFIGFMGAGKSRAARAAREAGHEVLDTDELLERELGMPIDEFFASHGEAEFRRREGAFESALLERTDGAVIALGGGSVLSESVREALGRHLVVWLEVDPETAWERVEGKRPLAATASASRRCSPSVARSTRRSPTSSCPQAATTSPRGRCRRSLRSAT